MQGQYRKAHELKVAADAMYHTELASTHAAWDLEVEMKKTKLKTKQQGAWCNGVDACSDIRRAPVTTRALKLLNVMQVITMPHSNYRAMYMRGVHPD